MESGGWPRFESPILHDRHHRDELYPMYYVIGPFLFFMSMLLMVWGRIAAHGYSLPEGCHHHNIRQLCCLGVCSFTEDIVPLSGLTLQLDL
jgi:hypothetical protein